MFIRKCPTCNQDIHHVNQYKLNAALKSNKSCRKCAQNTPERVEMRKKHYKKTLGKMDFSKEKNPFYGRKHSEETRSKLGKYKKSEEQIRIATKNLRKFSNKRPVFEIWKEKYGEEIANFKLKELKEKHRKNSMGSKNKMYGKPSPKGCGNGWKGWYKEWFFRSLKELSFMIKEIENKNLKWRTAETKEFAVQYTDYNGKIRNYFPDFILEESIIVEVKPKKLWETPLVAIKAKYAKEHFDKIGLIYKLVDVEVLPYEDMWTLYKKGIIRFTPKYETLFLSYNTKN